ncbi:MAG: histidinol-phosphate aminotransferase [Cyclobacteriaceae bacterium]|nr:MAG: histidinol-phosphate aminotransferase [Cyclobacteriaceae bacterium]
MRSIDQLVRDNIKDLKPYTSAREQYMDYTLTLLDANENPWGAIGTIDNHQVLNRYPDPYQQALKQKLSEIKDFPAERIFLGNGSDEIIDLLIRIFCEPATDEIITTAPTYGMYKVSAAINDVAVREVSLDQSFELNAKRILESATRNTKIVFLCSPNNPSGNLMDPSEVSMILDGFDGIVVIDEAYIEFAASEGFLAQSTAYPRLVVMQTFSKAWGLAGIRLGVGYTSTEMMHYLNKVKPPYNINQLTQKQALAAMEGAHEINMLVAKVQNAREYLRKEISQMGFVEKVYPSDANFLLVKMQEPRAVFDTLIENQVVVRDRSTVRYCEGCLRITVGTEEENTRLVDVLKRIGS